MNTNNKKIVFWITSRISDFGIPVFMKKKYDCDYFAIYDVPVEMKEYFKDQKEVEFKKNWFYRDYLKVKEPDMKYLKKIEDTYKINLWTIAYGERFFYKFNNYYKFNAEQILSILENQCRLFEEILEKIKPDYLVMKTTDTQENYLFNEMCKHKNIRVLTAEGTRFNHTMITEESDTIDEDFYAEEYEGSINSFEELEKYLENYVNESKKIAKEAGISFLTQLQVASKYLSATTKPGYYNFFGNKGRTPLKIIINALKTNVKGFNNKRYVLKHSLKNFESEKPFVYYALQHEPERVLNIAAPYYMNQLEVITNIAKSLPINVQLLVKEHPLISKNGWRTKKFYQDILNLQNVKMVDPYLDNLKIIKKSELVITIGGSSGMQSLFCGKPCIVFSDVGYQVLSAVFRVKNYEELSSIIKKAMDTKVNPLEIHKFLQYIEKHSFKLEFSKLVQESFDYIWYKGKLENNYIESEQMKQFLVDHEKEFNILIEHMLKKIEFFSKKI